jgi:hypothetical protein
MTDDCPCLSCDEYFLERAGSKGNRENTNGWYERGGRNNHWRGMDFPLTNSSLERESRTIGGTNERNAEETG